MKIATILGLGLSVIPVATADKTTSKTSFSSTTSASEAIQVKPTKLCDVQKIVVVKSGETTPFTTVFVANTPISTFYPSAAIHVEGPDSEDEDDPKEDGDEEDDVDIVYVTQTITHWHTKFQATQTSLDASALRDIYSSYAATTTTNSPLFWTPRMPKTYHPADDETTTKHRTASMHTFTIHDEEEVGSIMKHIVSTSSTSALSSSGSHLPFTHGIEDVEVPETSSSLQVATVTELIFIGSSSASASTSQVSDKVPSSAASRETVTVTVGVSSSPFATKVAGSCADLGKSPYTSLEGVQFELRDGSDINIPSYKTEYAIGPGTCITSCSLDDKCAAFTYVGDSNGGNCYYKASKGEFVMNTASAGTCSAYQLTPKSQSMLNDDAVSGANNQTSSASPRASSRPVLSIARASSLKSSGFLVSSKKISSSASKTISTSETPKASQPSQPFQSSKLSHSFLSSPSSASSKLSSTISSPKASQSPKTSQSILPGRASSSKASQSFKASQSIPSGRASSQSFPSSRISASSKPSSTASSFKASQSLKASQSIPPSQASSSKSSQISKAPQSFPLSKSSSTTTSSDPRTSSLTKPAPSVHSQTQTVSVNHTVVSHETQTLTVTEKCSACLNGQTVYVSTSLCPLSSSSAASPKYPITTASAIYTTQHSVSTWYSTCTENPTQPVTHTLVTTICNTFTVAPSVVPLKKRDDVAQSISNETHPYPAPTGILHPAPPAYHLSPAPSPSHSESVPSPNHPYGPPSSSSHPYAPPYSSGYPYARPRPYGPLKSSDSSSSLDSRVTPHLYPNMPVYPFPTKPAANTTKSTMWSTSTVYATSYKTVTQCPSSKTQCKTPSITTQTHVIPYTTTVCPSITSVAPPKKSTTKHSDIPPASYPLPKVSTAEIKSNSTTPCPSSSKLPPPTTTPSTGNLTTTPPVQYTATYTDQHSNGSAFIPTIRESGSSTVLTTHKAPPVYPRPSVQPPSPTTPESPGETNHPHSSPQSLSSPPQPKQPSKPQSTGSQESNGSAATTILISAKSSSSSPSSPTKPTVSKTPYKGDADKAKRATGAFVTPIIIAILLL